MKLLVCISNVPDTTTKVTFNNDNTQFNTAGVQYILNPYDEIALSKALDLAEGEKGTVTVIHVGEASAEPTIRKALAIGADNAIRINSEAKDGFYVASQIAEYAKDKNFDLILTGLESIDYNNGQVAGMLGELLNLPAVTMIKKLEIGKNTAEIQREIEGGTEILSLTLPAIVSCTEGLAETRIPNMRGIMSARTKPLEVIEPVTTEPLTNIIRFSTPSQRSAVKLFSPEEIGQLVEALHSEAKVI